MRGPSVTAAVWTPRGESATARISSRANRRRHARVGAETVARFADANAFGGSPLDDDAADDEKKEVGNHRRRARNSRVRASHRAASGACSDANAAAAARRSSVSGCVEKYRGSTVSAAASGCPCAHTTPNRAEYRPSSLD